MSSRVVFPSLRGFPKENIRDLSNFLVVLDVICVVEAGGVL